MLSGSEAGRGYQGAGAASGSGQSPPSAQAAPLGWHLTVALDLPAQLSGSGPGPGLWPAVLRPFGGGICSSPSSASWCPERGCAPHSPGSQPFLAPPLPPLAVGDHRYPRISSTGDLLDKETHVLIKNQPVRASDTGTRPVDEKV